MKVQCEVCSAEAASVFCCADEAALCDGCDRRVHRANRLAGKHHRFSLLHPSSSSAQLPPLCDVCKEKRGFLFCQEDRAILCTDCDFPIHSATALTMKHTRFLLTGLRLSAAPIPSSSAEEAEAADNIRGACNSSSSNTAATTNSNSSSIREYLMKMNMLPGWDVDDFLMDDATALAFCKTEVVKPFYVMDTSNNSVLNGYGGGLPIALPQVPHWVSGGGGIELEEVEMKASTDAKRPRISVRYS